MKNDFLNSKNVFCGKNFASLVLIFMVAITIVSGLSIVANTVFNSSEQILASSASLLKASNSDISFSQGPEGGSGGSAITPTLKISSASDLVDFALKVNSGNNYSERTVMITQKIDLSGVNFVSIGNSLSNYFAGTFDGGGYVIDNLAITGTSDAVGLFGYVNGATIKNVVVRGSVKATDKCEYAGGVAGYAIGGSFINCVNIARVENESAKITSDSKMPSAGGIVGYTLSSNFTLCRNYGTILCSSNADFTFCSAGICCGMAGTIERCYNCGMIQAGNASIGSSTACGICFYGTVTNCYNNGSITAYGPTKTQTYYFLLIDGVYKKDGVLMSYQRGPDYAPEEVPIEGGMQLATCMRYGSKNFWGSYTCHVYGVEVGKYMSEIQDDEFQKKEYISTQAYACGICFFGEVSNCYNYGSVSSRTETVRWTFSLRLSASYGYSDTQRFCFNFIQQYTYPICAFSSSVSNAYHNYTTIINISYYTINNTTVALTTSRGVSNEYAVTVKKNKKGTKTETHYFRVVKDSNSDKVRLYARNSDGSGLVTSIFGELKDLKAVFNGNDYISFEGLDVPGTKISNLSTINFNSSAIWDKGNSNINNGRPFIKELYW